MCTKNYDYMIYGWDKVHDGWMDRQTDRWKKWHIEVGARSTKIKAQTHRGFAPQTPSCFFYAFLLLQTQFGKQKQCHDKVLLADLLIGDSVLPLYFSESRTRSQNSTIVPIFQNLLLFRFVFYYVSQKYFFEYCGSDSQDKTRWELF